MCCKRTNLHPASPPQLAWSADKTVQQLGRTHRSNQLQPPRYIILSSDVCGEQRFATAVARRLEQLGALTQVRACVREFVYVCVVFA